MRCFAQQLIGSMQSNSNVLGQSFSKPTLKPVFILQCFDQLEIHA